MSRKLEKLGMWSSDTAELSFTDVRVPVSNTIGEIGRGFQQQMVQFQAERLMTFYKQVGSIALALERTKAYLRERRAFGAPLLANQHLQFVLAELGARHDVLKQYARTTADAVVRGEDATRFATIGKLLGSRLQREVADVAVQFHGGIGLHGRELDLALLPRHAPRLHRRRSRRGHAAHSGPHGRLHSRRSTLNAW